MTAPDRRTSDAAAHRAPREPARAAPRGGTDQPASDRADTAPITQPRVPHDCLTAHPASITGAGRFHLDAVGSTGLAGPGDSAGAQPSRPRKRSRHVALLLAGATVLTLAACEDKKVEAEAFPDLDSCLAAAQKDSLFFNADDCRTAFSDAKKNWEETAPRYEDKAICEQEHGVGNCGADPVAQPGGGFSFMPLFVGYMLGSMLGRGGGIFSQPMVRNGAGGFTTPNGNQSFTSNRGTGRVAPSTFNRAPATVGKAPLSAAQVSQRGGFGRSLTRSTGAGRSFGG